MNIPTTIPVCDLSAQFREHEGALRAALDRVLARSWFVLGEEGRLFEEEFASFVGVAHAAGVASGTDAIHLALRALGLKAGDRVLTVPNSAVPTAAAIVQAGCIPAFADVDPRTGLLDLEDLERRLTSDIRALIPVHLYGRCVPLGPVLELARRRGIPVIEDAAQAHGARWEGRSAGSVGDVGCFSFYPTKNLGAYGDGGACTTNDPALNRRLRELRNYGETARYQSDSIGFNSRLDEMQAAVLRAKLPRLGGWIERRREIARAYREELRDCPLALPPDPGAADSPHLFVVQVARRDRFRAELERRGVGTAVHYPRPIHLQKAYAWLGLGPGSFPHAEARAGRIATLPLYPELRSDQLEAIITAIREVLRGEPHPLEEA
mgnify:CR=1 FL=1